MTRRNRRIFYIGMICTEAYVQAIGEDCFIGAAAGKMSAVAAALRRAGRRTVLVSLPFAGGSGGSLPGRLMRGDGFAALFLPARRSPFVRKALGLFSLGWFAWRRVRRGDTVLFYNHAVEYLLALLILRLRGVAVFQDIEDVPTADDRGMRGLLNRLSFKLMFGLSSARKVTVSDQVGRALNLREFIAVQGIAARIAVDDASGKWERLDAGAPLRVHYGGTLMASTGLDLFCSAVRLLDEPGSEPARRIEFVVTGKGDFDRIRKIAASLRSDRLGIEVFPAAERSAYFDLLDACHASLSLKSPESEISSTTFPSKVIEIASRGLALVSTRVSDVGDIFSDDEAWLLPRFSDGCLADAILDMARNPTNVRRRAEAGQAMARARFAPLAVGRALTGFLEGRPIRP